MSGGGSSPPAQPATTTQIQDIPAWEQGYVTDLLGQAQSIAAQPYQQFPGQQIAGFTPDQLSAFQNVEGLQGNINPLQQAATGQAGAGANTANNIYGAGSPLVQASTAAATPGGIQQFMSPYQNDVVQGIQNEANLNWNQNIMPGINNEFTGSGQGMSGRAAQVLGQAAGNFQTGLSSNVANALESGYGMAGNQAATEAGIIGNAGSTLGNLAATQSGAQSGAGANLQNIAGAQNTNATNNAQALQAVGQQQQQLNQTNIDTAMTNWQNQVNWPASQTEYLNQIIRGLPAPSATTSSTQTTPAYSVSPLSAVGGTGASALSLLGAATGKKKGGLIKGYADGGSVDDEGNIYNEDFTTPLDYAAPDAAPVPAPAPTAAPSVPLEAATPQSAPDNEEMSLQAMMDDAAASPDKKPPLAVLDKAEAKPSMPAGLTESEMQRDQLLALARGMLTPSLGGSTAAAMGQGLGNMQDVQMKEREMQMNQQNLAYQRGLEERRIAQEQEKIDQGRYTPVKDFYGNVTGMVEGKSGKFTPVNTSAANPGQTAAIASGTPSIDPQIAATQILAEQGSVPTQVGNRFDIAGRNKQVDAYNNAALAAKSALQQLDVLDAQTGKYTPGKGANMLYSGEAGLGIDPTGGASARAEADKAAKALANSFMQANVGAKGSGIRMVQFDAGAVPNPDMPDEARTELIAKNKAIANSQIQRAVISNMYPRMQMSNVNTIMDTYEQKNPPIMPDGSANKNWMPYQDWLKAGRPDTTQAGAKPASSGKVITQADIEETAQKSGKSADEVRKAAIKKGYTIQ